MKASVFYGSRDPVVLSRSDLDQNLAWTTSRAPVKVAPPSTDGYDPTLVMLDRSLHDARSRQNVSISDPQKTSR